MILGCLPAAESPTPLSTTKGQPLRNTKQKAAAPVRNSGFCRNRLFGLTLFHDHAARDRASGIVDTQQVHAGFYLTQGQQQRSLHDWLA
jgi:hypothetical protein